MNSCSVKEMQEAERALIASGVSADILMESAGRDIARIIRHFYGERGRCIAFLGKGNNAGDALVVLRYLLQVGWEIALHYSADKLECSPLFRKQWSLLVSLCPQRLIPVESDYETPPEKGPVILLDGILGLGGRGSLSSDYRNITRYMNALRREQRLKTVAIDIPTGVNADTGECDDDAVIADMTVAIGAIKRGILNDCALNHVGRIATVELPQLTFSTSSMERVLSQREYAGLLPLRPYDWYKNLAGKVTIVAGSLGMAGAARLCAESAIKAGAGMVILVVPEDIYAIVASSVLPEIMVQPWSQLQKSVFSAKVLLIGPGLGDIPEERSKELLRLFSQFTGQFVLDADGLNLIARTQSQSLLGSQGVITPHEGEMMRLFPRQENESRCAWAKRFCDQYPVVLLLKGARTLIAQQEATLYYNPSGGPAMATAGEGDVLAGVIAALLAQGILPQEAALLGAYLCGMASDMALKMGETEQSLTASTTLAYLHTALAL